MNRLRGSQALPCKQLLTACCVLLFVLYPLSLSGSFAFLLVTRLSQATADREDDTEVITWVLDLIPLGYPANNHINFMPSDEQVNAVVQQIEESLQEVAAKYPDGLPVALPRTLGNVGNVFIHELGHPQDSAGAVDACVLPCFVLLCCWWLQLNILAAGFSWLNILATGFSWLNILAAGFS